MPAGPALQPGIERFDVAAVDHRQRQAFRVEQGSRFHSDRDKLARGKQQRGTSLPAHLPLADRQDPHRLRLGLFSRAFGEADRERSGAFARDGGMQQVAQFLRVAGGGQGQAGHRPQEGQVEDAVVRRAIVARDPRPVENEGDRQLMQADIHHDLIERALEEGGVDRDHRPQPGHGEPGGEGDPVLLRNPDVVEAIRETFRKGTKPGTAPHGGGDRDQPRLALGLFDQGLSKDVGVIDSAAQGLGGQHVESTDAVQVVDLVFLGRTVAATFGRDHVDYRRATEATDLAERALDVLDVVTVDRPGVFDAEIFEEGARRDQLFQTFLDAAAGFDRLVARGDAPQHSVDAIFGPVIAGVEDGELLRQVLGQSADGRGIGPAVVVDHDDHRGLSMADVVQRFVGHAASQGAVADDYDHSARLRLSSSGLGHPRGVAQPGRRMAVLDEIVLALGAVRVAAHAAQLAKPREALPRTRQQLVHVGLVAGVPQDPVFRAIENAVQRQGQLDHAKVGP